MAPLQGLRVFQHAEQFVSHSMQCRLLQVIVAILVIATITWTVVSYILQKKSRESGAIVDTPEKLPQCTLERHDSATFQTKWKSEHNNYLSSLQQEILHQTEKPIYPWISPPQALPGPYDPMYYPLPAPSLRHTPHGSLSAGVEGRFSTCYTRLVPKARTPLNENVLYGTMTTSTNGWRRSHWNVTGG